ADRLLAPLLVQCRSHRAAYRFGGGVSVAPPRPRQAFHGRYHYIEHDVVERLAGRILLGDTDQINLRIVRELAFFGHGDRDKDAAGKSHPPPFHHGPRLGILQDIAVLVEPARWQFVDDAGVPGPELDQIAVAADQHFWHAGGARQLGVFRQMQRFAMYGDQELRAYPRDHVAQFVAARMTGDVDQIGAVGDDLDA